MKKITLLLCLMTVGLASAQYANMAIVGDGAGGWPGADGIPDIHQMTATDGIHWTYDNLALTNGFVKFRTGNHWNPNTDNWGAPAGGAWPTGTGVVNSTTNISTVAGIYDVTFNSTTLEYTFTVQNLYPTISLTGEALDGIPEGGDVDLFTTDGITYTGTDIHFIAGDVKFRQDHSWTTNWGNISFPAGVGTQDGVDIEVPGTMVLNVMFNRTTGAYSFSLPTVAVVGSATLQGWPIDPQIDLHVLSTSDGISYTLNSIALVTGAAKFREGNSWSVQWGSDTDPGSFPTGTGVQNDNHDIPVMAGTYSITLNRTTGAYVFGAPLSAAQFNSAAFKVYPNPTRNNWNFSSTGEVISTIRLMDFSGKVIMQSAPASNEATIDASNLSTGMYFANIATASGSKTIKVVKQ